MVLLRLKKMIPKILLHVMTMHTKLFCVLVVPFLKIIITNFPIKGIDQIVLCMVLNMVNFSLTSIVLRYSHLKHCKCLFTGYCTKLLSISINSVVKCLNYILILNVPLSFIKIPHVFLQISLFSKS